MKTHILFIITFIPILLVGQNNGDRFIQQGHPYDLLGGSINTITQDNWGFLWFGTDNGLSRFDGYNFKHLHNKSKSNKTNPSKNYIKKIFLDSENRLWIGMHKGLSIYDDAIYDLRSIPEFDNLYINSLKEDANKNIWVATHNGIYILSKDSKEIYHIGAENSSELDNKKVNFIVPDQHNNFWAFSEYGIHKIWTTDQNNIKTSFSFTNKCKVNISSYSIKGRIGFFVIDKENNAYFSVDNTIYTINLENDTFNLNDASIVAQGEEYLCAQMDSYNNLWVGTRYRGITLFKKKSDVKFTQKKYWISPNRSYDISNTVTTLYEDNLGNIWVGTPKELFAMKRNNTQNFNSIREGEDSSSLTNRIVTGVLEDENTNIWITTSYGLNKLSWLNKDKKSVHIDHYINEINKDQNFDSSNSLQSLISKDQNTLWISTKKNILSYNIKNEQFFEDKQLSDFLKNNNLKMARCFFKDEKNNIWIGFEFGGICIFLADKNEFVRLGTIDSTFDDGDYWAITKDARDYIWIGSKRKGLFKIKINMDSLGMSQNSISYKKQYLPTKWITSVFINKDNIAWVGTSNEAYHYASAIDDFEELKMIGPSDQSTYISGITEDQNDALWFSTTTGIFKFDENKQLTQAYNTNEHDFAKINYQFSTFCAHDGTIYMGGINGLTYFSPNLLQADTIKQKIFISDFKVLNRPFSLEGEKNINLTRLVHLSYKENQFAFEFSTLYLTDPYKIKYRYKLEGLDKDWIYVDTNRNHASYSNLAPGNYKFCVQSTTRSGEWTNNENVIEVIIAPPFWATWWAYCIYILILILIVFFIIYLNYVKGIYGQQKKYNQWKTELYTNIINSFDTPLFLLKAPLENMIGSLHNMGESEIEELLKIMNQNVKRLRHLVKQLSEIQKIEVNETSLQMSKVDLIPFIQNVYNLFFSIAQNKNLHFEYHHTKDSIEVHIDIEKIEIILLNLLSNIFRNTKENGRIVLNCYVDNKNQAWIELFSNDIDIKSQESHNIYSDNSTDSIFNSDLATGLGFTLAKDFVELHGGKLHVEHIVGKGCTFSFFLPKKQQSINFSDAKLNQSYLESYIDIEKDLDITANSSELLNEKGNKHTILLVEKDKETSILLSKILIKNNYRPKVFNSIEEIYNAAVNLEPSLILFNLTVDSKYELLHLCKSLKDNIQTCHIPILLILEKDAEERESVEGYEAGADACISKPFEISYLMIRIKHLINIRQSIKEKVLIDESIFSEKERIATTSSDENFLNKIMKIIEGNIANENFNLEEFSKQANISRSVLNTKIQSLVGQTPIEFVKTIRLKKAAHLLETNAYTISEISMIVGFTDPGYFSTCFKKQYNEAPSEYVKNRKTSNKR